MIIRLRCDCDAHLLLLLPTGDGDGKLPNSLLLLALLRAFSSSSPVSLGKGTSVRPVCMPTRSRRTGKISWKIAIASLSPGH